MKRSHWMRLGLSLLLLTSTACVKMQRMGLEAGGISGPGDTTGGGTGTGTVAQRTASQWLGINGDAEYPYVDITHNLSAFDATSKGAEGLPAAGVTSTSSTDLGFSLPAGDYKVSYVGPDNAVTFSGIASLTGGWQVVNGEHRATIHTFATRGSFGHPLIVTITNPPSDRVTSLHIYYSGHDYGDTRVFNDTYKRMLSPFRAIRLMGMMATNLGFNAQTQQKDASGNWIPQVHISEWADRPLLGIFGRQDHHDPLYNADYSFGMPYDAIPALANETGKDLWVNIPEYASDDFVTQWAEDLRSHLDVSQIRALRAQQGLPMPFHLIIEYSNETWNGGFFAPYHLAQVASANASRYGGGASSSYGPAWMLQNSQEIAAARVEADRLVHFIQIIRSAFSDVSANDIVVDSVLSGCAQGPSYSDMGMQFIASHYPGSPKDYITYVAPAGYFGPDGGKEGVPASFNSLSTLFSGFAGAVDAVGNMFDQFKSLADHYGVQLTIYEGGQGMGSWNDWNNNTYDPWYEIKHLAQFDRRMYDVYERMWALWRQKFGNQLYMHFSLSGGEGSPDYRWWSVPIAWRVWGWWNSIPYQETDLSACGQNMPSYGDPTQAEAKAQIESLHTQISPPCPKYQSLLQHIND